jgi:hypothetical protein
MRKPGKRIYKECRKAGIFILFYGKCGWFSA